MNIAMMNTTDDGISHARFCSFKGKCCTDSGKLNAATFRPSKIPNKNAIAVTGATTYAGLLKYFHKKLSKMTTIAGGYIALKTGTDTAISLVKPKFEIMNEKPTKIKTKIL